MKLRVLLVACLSLATVALAEDKPAAPATPPPTPPPPAPAPAAGEKVFAPTDLEGLKAVKGQNVIVEGTLARAGEAKTKTVRYLNFTSDYAQGVSLVFFVAKNAEEFTMEKLNPWVGKKVRVTGKLSEFNGRLQLEIEKLDQLKELPKEVPAQ